MADCDAVLDHIGIAAPVARPIARWAVSDPVRMPDRGLRWVRLSLCDRDLAATGNAGEYWRFQVSCCGTHNSGRAGISDAGGQPDGRCQFCADHADRPHGLDMHPLATATAAPVGQANGSLAQQLDVVGHAILHDLDFTIGSAELSDAAFASLAELAAYLAAYPDRSVALVGHTDSAGALDINIALSQRRARSVLDRLVTGHGVNRRQLAAEGMGYLAPIASNQTETGRDANRRVEVIVTSTD